MADELTPPPWTLENIVEAVRERLDDLPGDVVVDQDWKSNDDGLLWSNSELTQYADEAQQEVARRRPIKDNTTVAVTQIAVVALTPTYAYHKSILAIEEPYFVETISGIHHALKKYSHADMLTDYQTWRADTAGKPTLYIEDLHERSITLYRTPDVAGTLYLTTRRLPVRRLNWSIGQSAKLEVDAEHQYDMLDWILYRAYLKDDIETSDAERARRHLDAFTLAIGERPSARVERLCRVERNTNRRTRAHFF